MDQEELINAYLEGKLGPEDRKLLEDLIATHPEYQAELDLQRKLKVAITLSERESLRSFLKELPEASGAKPASRLKLWFLSGAAACAMVLVGYFLWTMLSLSPGEKLYARHYSSYPNLIAPSTRANQAQDLKSRAFLAYDNGDFTQAEGLFEQLRKQPEAEYALLYLGISQLELGRPEKAISNLILISANTNSEYRAVGAWYAALGYFKLDMLDKGKAQLEVTASLTNSFQKEAQEILKKL